jgi:hypothetical protein
VCALGLRRDRRKKITQRTQRRGGGTQEHRQECLCHKSKQGPRAQPGMAVPQERPASEGGPYKKNKRGRRKAAPTRLNGLGAQAEACATWIRGICRGWRRRVRRVCGRRGRRRRGSGSRCRVRRRLCRGRRRGRRFRIWFRGSRRDSGSRS